MSLKEFLTSKVFLKHFLALIALTFVLIIFALLSLRFYTHHGEAFLVPNVYGLTEGEYSRVLSKANLHYTVVDSTYNDQIKPGGVVDQVPEAGHKVKRKRVIYLTHWDQKSSIFPGSPISATVRQLFNWKPPVCYREKSRMSPPNTKIWF